MNRREAILAGGAAAILASVPGVRAAAGSISPAAKALYRRAMVLDCNLTPPLDNVFPYPPAEVDMARHSGVTAMKTSLTGFSETFEDAVGNIALVQRMIEYYPDVYLQVRRISDFARAKREGRIGIILSFEGVTAFEGKLERFELFRGLGVQIMQLSYNPASPFGAGVLAEPSTLGLTELGHKAVEAMNRLGIAIDLSHANAATTEDAIKASTRPVLITHAGCSAIHPHVRNKTDAQLKAVADKGGVVGIYDLPYLTPSPRQPALEDYIAHMLHALKVCGEDHVGIGSDTGVEPFDTSPKGLEQFQAALEQRRKAGVAAPEEDRPTFVVGLNTPRRCEVIADALLKHGVSERVAEKILGSNFVRALGDIWVA